MPLSSNAFVSLDNIINSTLLRRGYSIHYYYRFLKLAGDAVRELQLSSMPLVQHTILTRNSDESWFHLPKGFTDYVEVGIRIGELWRPIGVSNRLMPYPNTDGQAEYNSSFNGNYNKGAWTNWLDGVYQNHYGQFAGTSFFNQDFLVDDSTTTEDECCQDTYPYRKDVVTFNTQKGIIMCPKHFPCDKLYLTYISVGTVDTMTHIPIQAQAVIEAYMDWKYAANKRTSTKGERDDLKALFYNELRIYRARNNDMSMTDIAQIMNRYYGQQNYYSTYYDCREHNTCGCSSSSCNCATTDAGHSFTITLNRHNLIINSTDPNNIIYTVTDLRLANKTLSYVIADGPYYNDAFWSKPYLSDSVQTTQIPFYIGQRVTLVYE